MPSSYTLSYDARRRTLLSSSYSPRLPDPSQFPVSAILAKLPPLPDSPLLDAPDQPGSPIPPTSPTPNIAPAPVPTTGTDDPTVSSLRFSIDNYNGNDSDDLPQAQGPDSDSDSNGPRPQPQAAAASDLLQPALKPKAQPLDASGKSKKKRYLGSRAVAWWTRFTSKRG